MKYFLTNKNNQLTDKYKNGNFDSVLLYFVNFDCVELACLDTFILSFEIQKMSEI